MVENYYNIKFEILKDTELKVTNLNEELAHIHFKNPLTNHSVYANHKFTKEVWVSVNTNQFNSSKINIEILFENSIVLIEYDIINSKFKDISTPLVKCNNFYLVPNLTTFIIAAYKAENFILETLKSINDLSNPYHKIEILLGIDACFYTSMKLLRSKLSDNIKIYFFEENIGPYVIFNTLAEKSKGSNLIFFGADDLAMPNLLEEFNKYIINYDMVRFSCYSFQDGIDYTKEENLTLYPVVVGGCKGIKKDIFLKLNGYLKWRVSADDEFGRRLISNEIPYIDLQDNPTFLYRQHSNNISYNPSTNQQSILRNIYRGLLTDRINNNTFPNPEKLMVEQPIKIY